MKGRIYDNNDKATILKGAQGKVTGQRMKPRGGNDNCCSPTALVRIVQQFPCLVSALGKMVVHAG